MGACQKRLSCSKFKLAQASFQSSIFMTTDFIEEGSSLQARQQRLASGTCPHQLQIRRLAHHFGNSSSGQHHGPRVNLICSSRGKILRRRGDGRLRYEHIKNAKSKLGTLMQGVALMSAKEQEKVPKRVETLERDPE